MKTSNYKFWNGFLTFVLVIFMIVRLGAGILRFYASNKAKERKPKEILDVSPYVMTIEQAEKNAEKKLTDIKNRDKKIRNILYSQYVELENFNASEKGEFGLHKLEKDSVMFVDFKTQIRIPKGYYLKSNNGDSLISASKSPNDLNVFVRNFRTEDNFEKCLKKIKSKNNLENYQTEDSWGNMKSISYKINPDERKFNGIVFCFDKNEYGLITFYEFESNKLSIKELKNISKDFLAQNLMQVSR
ncbi:hypothetical protein [Flavobacterium ginsenosidimutans]|uniref:hypothetical protein n=1 Tax=Flavobacterium ginsenosidimutans TaxID=687844 RepID=UPI0013A63503|nr:hypothetical protein [Flavobacterium ginsenosidimutans]KAF2331804.1 hypothetical protein DM444_11425 [Flavobacterium ginsenosidimutans]